MILSNPFRPDPRVDQEAKTLSAQGHQVTVICWDRHGELARQETRDGFGIVRIQNVNAGYGTGWRLAPQIPRFWRQAVRLTAGDASPTWFTVMISTRSMRAGGSKNASAAR